MISIEVNLPCLGVLIRHCPVTTAVGTKDVTGTPSLIRGQIAQAGKQDKGIGLIGGDTSSVMTIILGHLHTSEIPFIALVTVNLVIAIVCHDVDVRLVVNLGKRLHVTPSSTDLTLGVESTASVGHDNILVVNSALIIGSKITVLLVAVRQRK